MKNAFYFILKALFVLKIFLVMNFWSCRKKSLVKKYKANLMSQPG